ncbi:hypothetical protein BKA80DRAFT_130608 [Phyllosticta citrichinensis]
MCARYGWMLGWDGLLLLLPILYYSTEIQLPMLSALTGCFEDLILAPFLSLGWKTASSPTLAALFRPFEILACGGSRVGHER